MTLSYQQKNHYKKKAPSSGLFRKSYRYWLYYELLLVRFFKTAFVGRRYTSFDIWQFNGSNKNL